MDRAPRANIIAKSGRAVDTAGDVDTVPLDKTGTITLGSRRASEFLPLGGVTVRDLSVAAALASVADCTAPDGAADSHDHRRQSAHRRDHRQARRRRAVMYFKTLSPVTAVWLTFVLNRNKAVGKTMRFVEQLAAIRSSQ